jgi:hypothetical protein
MTFENFYNNMFFYSPNYYPGFLMNKKQKNYYLAQFPYLNEGEKPKLDLQIFYNVTNGNSIPWGSTYKYTIPKPIDEVIEPSHSSISERQKRFRREHFNNNNNNNNNNTNIIIAIIIAIIFIIMCQ